MNSRLISGTIFALNYAAAAYYLDAVQGMMVFLMVLLSTVAIWQADILSTTRTDYFMRERVKRGFLSNLFRKEDGFEPSVIIDRESPKGCVSALGWITLIASSIYNLVLINRI